MKLEHIVYNKIRKVYIIGNIEIIIVSIYTFNQKQP